MDSTKYIGRVGALAVALGIGTALTCGTGVASADDGGSNDGTSGKTGAQTSESKSATAGTPSRKRPLSKVGERIRKDIESNIDTAGTTVKPTQSRLDTSLTRRIGSTIKSRATIEGTISGAVEEFTEQITRPTVRDKRTHRVPSADAPDAVRIVPEAVSTVPTPRTDSVIVKVKEAADNVRQRRPEPIVTPSDQVPVAAEPITTSATPVTAPPSVVIEAPKPAAATMVSALLAATGLSPLAGTNPAAPGPSPALWAMMAWTRRESDRALTPNGTSLVSANDAASVVAEAEIQPLAATAAQTNDLTAKPTVPKSLTNYTERLGWVTGPGVTDHWYVAGTDLGIMWNSGYTDPTTGKAIIYTLFGDTYSGPNMTGDWRNNVLFRTSDTDMSNGLQFSDALIHAGASPTNPGTPTWYGTGGAPAGAAQIIYDPGYNGLFGTTHTMIPTSAIAIKNADGTYTQYATVMSVRTWDNPGSWTTNYSGIAVSHDGGKTWTVDPTTVRSSGWLRSSKSYVPGDEHFQQNALVMSDDPSDPYVYVYGTPSGRQGSAYLARVEKDQITNLGAYQYWAGENSNGTGKWVSGDPSSAVAVFGSSSTDFLPTVYRVADFFTFGLFTKIANGIWVGGLPTNGNVSEMSVQYNEYLGKYVVLYTDGGNNVVMRVSDSPQGEWSDTTTLVSNGLNNSGMYGPMVHPMSGTGYFNTVDANGVVVQDNSQYLYYNLSYWGDYNVRLMQTDLEPMKQGLVTGAAAGAVGGTAATSAT